MKRGGAALVGAFLCLASRRPARATEPPPAATAPPPPPTQPPPEHGGLVRAPGAPPRTAINEEVGTSSVYQYFFLHDDNYVGLQLNGGWPPRAKFQVSLRFDMVSLGDVNNFGLNFAYTQKSFWDVLDLQNSSPFIENDYKPEFFLSYRPRRQQRFREIQLGFQHESNGLGVTSSADQLADSRSWEAVFVDARWGITRSWTASPPWFWVTPGIRAWYPFGLAPEQMRDVLWYGYAYLDIDTRIPSMPEASRISARLKLRRHNFEANVYYPLLPFVSEGKVAVWIFFQLFTGKAERLITYDQQVTHLYLGLGFQ